MRRPKVAKIGHSFQQATIIFAALVGIILPATAPFLKTSHADEVGTSFTTINGGIFKGPGGGVPIAHAIACKGGMIPGQTLAATSIDTSLGRNPAGDSGNTFNDVYNSTGMYAGLPRQTNIFGYLGLPAAGRDPGAIPEATATAWTSYIYDHFNQRVTTLGLFQGVNGPGLDPCGSGPNRQSDTPHLVMIPVADDTWVASQYSNIIAQGGVGQPALIIFHQTGLSPAGNAVGSLSYWYPDSSKGIGMAYKGLDTQGKPINGGPQQNVIVEGVSTSSNPVATGNVSNAEWVDVSTIKIQVSYNGGAPITETYINPSWDNHSFYFLASTPSPTRQALIGAAKQADPFSNAAQNQVPFIWIPDAGFTEHNGEGILNLSYDRLSQSPGLGDLNHNIAGYTFANPAFYDYSPGNPPVPVGHDGKNPALPAGQVITNSSHLNGDIWFYGSKASNAFVTAWTKGNGNEQNYIGVYTFDNASKFYVHSAKDCSALGQINLGTTIDNITPNTEFPIPKWTLEPPGQSCQPPAYGSITKAYAIIDDQKFTAISGIIAGAAANSNGNNQQLICDIGWNPLTWLICPIAQGAISLAGTFDTAINDMLNISVNTYLDESKPGSAGADFYAAWNSFRVISMALIVIAGLIMVMSQALGAELLNAYTIKKMLPRLLMAVVFIAASWQLLKAAVTASDVVGYGTRYLIYKPFSTGLGAAHIGAGTSDVLGVLGGAAVVGLGIFGILSFALTGLLASLVGFVLLTFREMVVLFAIAISPVPIALSILPNTRKGWKIWGDTLSGALLMFPIVAGFIAIGHVFAQVAAKVNAGVIGQLIFIIAYFAPYFLIPLAFRLAGGLVATVGGVVNDRSKGAFDRLKNYRSNKFKTNMQKVAEGRRFNELGQFQSNNLLARTANRGIRGLNRGISGFNDTTEVAGAFGAAEAKFGFLTNRGIRQAALSQHRDMVGAKYAQTGRAQATKEDDLLHQARTFGSEEEARAGLAARFRNMNYDVNTDEGRRNMEAALSAARAAGGYSRAYQRYSLRRLAATGTGYGDVGDMLRAVSDVAGDNRAEASALLGELNAVSGNVGRHDLKLGYGTQMRLYDRLQAAGHLTEEEVDDAVYTADKDLDSVSRIRDKKVSVENLSKSTARVFRRLEVQRDTATDPVVIQQARDELDRATGLINKAESAFAYGSTTNVQATNDNVGRATSGANTGLVVENAAYNPALPPSPTNPQTIYVPATGRRRVQMEANPVETKINPTTDRPEITYEIARYPAGHALAGQEIIDEFGTPTLYRDPDTGRPVLRQNPATNAVTQRSAENQRIYGVGTGTGDPQNNGLIT